MVNSVEDLGRFMGKMKRFFNSFADEIPAAFIDGVLYCAIGWFAFSQMFFGGDEAAKYIDPKWKFYLNYILGSGAIICANLKSYRSTNYADHQAEKKLKNGHTELLYKTETLTKP